MPCMDVRPYCLWTRFTASTRDSRTFLLPYVENGTIILIGATTENPYFEVNGALISRSLLFELKPLNAEDIKSYFSVQYQIRKRA